MKKEFNWEEFINDRILVHCKTEEEVCEELSKFAYNDKDRHRYKNGIDLNIVRNRLFYKDKE